jgi:hypothetical protein
MEVSHAAEFQTSRNSHKEMLRKVVQKVQMKLHVMGFALSNTTFGISRISTLDTVYEMLYGMTKSTLEREAVKFSFFEHAYKEHMGS